MEYFTAKMNGNRSRLKVCKGLKRHKEVCNNRGSRLIIIILKFEIRKLNRDY
jgi:hypothetical protein